MKKSVSFSSLSRTENPEEKRRLTPLGAIISLALYRGVILLEICSTVLEMTTVKKN